MPAMPPGIATVILTGRYVRPDGTPLLGTVSVTPSAHLTFPDADTVSVGGATVELDENGAFSIALIATDQPGMDPTDWTYQVVEKFHRIEGRSYSIKLPPTTPVVDVADIAPADPSHGDYVLVPGPAGRAGSQILSGTGAPSNTAGINGDFYIDTTAGAVKLFGPKAASAWPSTGVTLSGTNVITSVNGKTGAVALTAADVGAYPATGGNLTGSLTATAGLRVNTTDVNVNALITDSPVGSAARVAVMRVGGVDQFSLNAVGALTVAGGVTAGSGSTSVLPNLKLGSSSASLGGSVGGAIAVPNVTTAPSSNPTGGVVVYAEGGGLKVRQSDGTTVTVGSVTTTKSAVFPSPTGAVSYVVWRAPKACTVTAVRGYRVGGTGTTINASRNGTADLATTDLSLSTSDTWLSGATLQNTAFAAGDSLVLKITGVTGTPSAVTVQVDVLQGA